MNPDGHSLDDRAKRRAGWHTQSTALSSPPPCTPKTPTAALLLEEGLAGPVWWFLRMALTRAGRAEEATTLRVPTVTLTLEETSRAGQPWRLR